MSLFKAEALTYDTALKEAIARETALKNASSARASDNKNPQKELFAIDAPSGSNTRDYSNNPNRRGKSQGTPHQQRNDWRPNNGSMCANCGGRGHAREQCSSPIQNKQRDDCASCGKPGHRRYTCKFRDATCDHCHKQGHIESACFTKRAQEKKQIKKLERDDDEAEDTSSDEQTTSSVHFVHRSDFYPLKIEDTTRKISSNFVSGDRDDGEPMFVGVSVNGTEVNMEIDTGTYATVISEKILKENFKNAKVTKTGVNLRGYDSRLMKPIGKLSNITVDFHGKRCVLDCFVLTG